MYLDPFTNSSIIANGIVDYLLHQGLHLVNALGWNNSPDGCICVLKGEIDLDDLSSHFVLPESVQIFAKEKEVLCFVTRSKVLLG